MSRQLEAIREQRRVKRDKAIVFAVEYGLVAAVERSGGELQGFSVKDRPGECMLVLRAIFAGRPQVAFVGSEDLGSALIKAVREGNSDRLRWREDRYAGPGTIADS